MEKILFFIGYFHNFLNTNWQPSVTKAKFKFLGLGGKPDAKLRKMWDLAQIILKTVVKMKTGVAEVIIKQLSKRIMYSKAAPRYTDTGYSLSDQHINCSEFQNSWCEVKIF